MGRLDALAPHPSCRRDDLRRRRLGRQHDGDRIWIVELLHEEEQSILLAPAELQHEVVDDLDAMARFVEGLEEGLLFSLFTTVEASALLAICPAAEAVVQDELDGESLLEEEREESVVICDHLLYMPKA